jgi:acetyltransferase-like isoleucine patch superfamily enzyme
MYSELEALGGVSKLNDEQHARSSDPIAAPPFTVTGPRATGRFRLTRMLRNLWDGLYASIQRRRYAPETRALYFRKMGAQIGEDCYIVPTSLGAEPYLVKLGNHVAIAGDVEFMTHDGATWLFRNEVPDLQVFGPIVIKDNCIIGQRAIIFPNVSIGPNSVVGAGSVVINDVPPNTIVLGVPARPFGGLDKYREKCLQRWAEQRPPDAVLEAEASWWDSVHWAENRERLRKHLLAVFRDQLG